MSSEPHPRNTRLQVATLAAGAGMIGFGVWSLLRTPVDPVQFAVWMGGSIIAHDLVLAPLVFGTGWLTRRLVPARRLAPVQAGLIWSGMLTLFLVPALSARGSFHGDLGRLSDHYLRSLAIVLGCAWALALVWAVAGRRRA